MSNNPIIILLLAAGYLLNPPSRGREEKGRVISKTQVERTIEDGLLLFNNQRDVEKYQILAYKIYSIIDHRGVFRSVNQETLCLDYCLAGTLFTIGESI
jgi:hypothetical protein